MQRKLLDLQHDESIRIVNDTRKEAEQEHQALKDTSPSDAEHTEAKLAIRLCTNKVRKSDKAERLARLTRDMDKRRTRAERSPAPTENRENGRGKKTISSKFRSEMDDLRSKRKPTICAPITQWRHNQNDVTTQGVSRDDNNREKCTQTHVAPRCFEIVITKSTMNK